MKKRFIISTFVAFLLAGLISSTALAARPDRPGSGGGGGGGKTSEKLGIDVSWPQCGKTLPTDQAFGIVGINDGLANTTNPCLADQLIWAKNSLGGTNQDKVQLYVNTANPGGLGTASWPSSNIDPAGNLAPNPFDTCDNSDSLACAWQYGWNRAVEDNLERFVPAAGIAGISASADDYIWWLDVETINTWKYGGNNSDFASNTAVLEGMTEYFQSVNARVGLYSTAYQWGEIVGNGVQAGSNLIGLDNWRPGGANLKTAKQACSAAPLTTGGQVVLTQFISKNLDYNYSCVN